MLKVYGKAMTTWQESAREALTEIYAVPTTSGTLPLLRILLDTMIDKAYISDGGGKPEQEAVANYWGHLGKVALEVNTDKAAMEFETVLAVLIRKQRDYGHENIRRFGRQGLMVRMHDKIARLENLYTRAAAPSNESIADNLLDVVGYSAIGIMWERETFLNPLAPLNPELHQPRQPVSPAPRSIRFPK